MKIKTVITTILSLFVLTSVTYLVITELQSHGSTEEPINEPVELSPAPEKDLPAKPSKNISETVVVYYFHGTARCVTCKKFEAYSNEVINNVFAKELSSGQLKWQRVNVDEPVNKHFVNDYKLFSKSIVVVKLQDGKEVEWKNLDQTWRLVSNKETFTNYIKQEIKAYLGAE